MTYFSLIEASGVSVVVLDLVHARATFDSLLPNHIPELASVTHSAMDVAARRIPLVCYWHHLGSGTACHPVSNTCPSSAIADRTSRTCGCAFSVTMTTWKWRNAGMLAPPGCTMAADCRVPFALVGSSGRIALA